MTRWKFPKKISHECLDALIAEKFSQSEIARVCNCSRQAINRRIPGYKPNRISNFNKDEYKVFWARIWGLSGEQIAKRFSFSKTNVSHYICLQKECLVGYKYHVGPKLNIKALCLETKSYWYRIQGLSWLEIGRRMNFSSNMAGQYVRKNPELKIKKR